MEAQLWDSQLASEHPGPRYRTRRRFDGHVVRMCDVNTAEIIELNNSRQHNFIEDPSRTGQTLRWSSVRNTSRQRLDGAGVSAVMSRTVTNRKREPPFIQLADRRTKQQLVNLLLLAKRKYWEATGTREERRRDETRINVAVASPTWFVMLNIAHCTFKSECVVTVA